MPIKIDRNVRAEGPHGGERGTEAGPGRPQGLMAPGAGSDFDHRVEIGMVGEQRCENGLGDPADLGVRVVLAQRREHRQGVHDVSHRAGAHKQDVHSGELLHRGDQVTGGVILGVTDEGGTAAIGPYDAVFGDPLRAAVVGNPCSGHRAATR